MRRFAGLEICRFLCALSVVVWHYQHFFVKGVWDNSISYAQRSTFPFYSLLSPFYQNGYNAVQIFWVISGFIFFWKYGDAIHERSIASSDFFALRFSRLYPLHLATLIAVATLQFTYLSTHHVSFVYGSNDNPHLLLQLGLASNWSDRQPFTFNGPIWSVSAEILAYVFFFAAVRFVKPGLSLCASVLLMTTATTHYHPHLVLMCIQFFFYGGLVQQIIMRLGRRGRMAAFWCAGGAVALALAEMRGGEPATSTSLLVLSVGLVVVFALVDTIGPFDGSKLDASKNLALSARP